ncbi:MAG: hypothetical protein S4CHLAM37_07090 [Chlamydiia bacterium]|nr:hypothetical protein [Chlamydiia bacterium]
MASIPDPTAPSNLNADILLESVESTKPITFDVDGKIQAVATGPLSIFSGARSLKGRCSHKSKASSVGAITALAERGDVSDRDLFKIINKLVANCLLPDIETGWRAVNQVRMRGASPQVTEMIGMKLPEVQDPTLAKCLVSCELFHSRSSSPTEQENLKPIAAESGSSGVYFIKDPLTLETTGVFKPSDEEAFCEHNPKHMTLPAGVKQDDVLWDMRSGYSFGGDCKREIGSHAIAEALGYGFIPTIREVSVPFKESSQSEEVVLKSGSIQVYVRGTALVDDPKLLASVPPSDLQRAALFDILTDNADRHVDNVIIDDGEINLIDQGRCLGTQMYGGPTQQYHNSMLNSDLVSLPACKIPTDPTVIKEFASMNTKEVEKRLLELGLSEKEIKPMLTRHKVMCYALKKGYTPHEVAILIKQGAPRLMHIAMSKQGAQFNPKKFQADLTKLFFTLVDRGEFKET